MTVVMKSWVEQLLCLVIAMIVFLSCQICVSVSKRLANSTSDSLRKARHLGGMSSLGWPAALPELLRYLRYLVRCPRLHGLLRLQLLLERVYVYVELAETFQQQLQHEEELYVCLASQTLGFVEGV